MQTFRPENGRLVPCDRGEGNIVWYSASVDEDRREMFRSTDFKQFDVESSLDPEEISRIEFDEDLTVIIVKRPKRAAVKESIRFEVSSVGIFLEPDRLTFVTSGDPIEFGTKPFHPGFTLIDVVLRFLSITIHHFLSHLKVIKMLTTEIQAHINTSMENKYLLQMFSLVESLIYYRNSIESNEAMLYKFTASAPKMRLSERQTDYLTDIVMENSQSIKQSGIYSEVLTGMMDAQGNLINNNVNVLLKKLTLINVVFLPLNLLAGIGGMSEYSRFTERIPAWISYPLFILGIIILALFCWGYLLPKLERPPRQPF